jgi:RNA polymerase sigma-70 factor (ECF subfamily)
MSEAADRLYERVLVLRCQAFDPAAFEELVERYGPRLRYYLRKMLRQADIDDALQDVWCDALGGLHRLVDPAALPAWLYRIARVRAIRILRKRGRTWRPLPMAEVPEPAGDAEEFTAEDAGQVHAALDRLAPEHREVLVLRFLESMAYEDIARVVGCSTGTVASRIHYAKRALRHILDAENTDE